ncbi:glutathione peroxidase [Paenibacillus sp. J2TS4]|uniref:glutathione peroxidase n=1 Tax=Paenibacillus sp. J2TS4 TaxID=2807194 RepID=UPI001B05D2BC|nr:glutathione peroxidase [Paenibacillus sp. J2TS4]GIP32692.1 glutathione peroxidase [Paenibacillus sp. J2TS4]
MEKSIFDLVVNGADGQPISMDKYKGRVLLIVNVASQCGFTPQYEALEKLHRAYKERGLTVLAFPSNDFGGQEPGSMDEIVQFCRTKYDVTFDVMEKVHAIGDQKHPLFQWLTAHSDSQEEVQWNFEKFLISRDGQLIARYGSRTSPDDADLVSDVEAAL